MRRSSYTPIPSQTPQEPLIVVEESGGTDDEDEDSRPASPPMNLNPDSPMLNPYLLSPYRDMRKRSLPTPACTSGITASQVRRLSEHGAEGAGANVREAAFLATLSSAPTPAPGGRRHSVVTISRAPPPSILFGRGRRESIAAFPAAALAGRVLPMRRDSTSSVPRPPTTSSTSGSTFNLQLDIMDDIAEIKAARKVRLKMWRTPSRERVCEVQPLEDPGSSAAGSPPTRYHQQASTSGRSPAGDRRYSDFTSMASTSQLQPQPPTRRRASEQVPGRKTNLAGIVCSNTDLISILSSLASSAQEINQPPEEAAAPTKIEEKSPPKATASVSSAEQKRRRLKGLRSNSFDVSMLLGTEMKAPVVKGGAVGPASWFVKRHQPKSTKPPTPVVATMKDEKGSADASKRSSSCKSSPTLEHKVVWDGRSGSVVDAQVLGSAIEVFLARRGSGNEGTEASPSKTPAKQATGSWFSSGAKQEDEEAGTSDTCDSSICSTLKDLFVK